MELNFINRQVTDSNKYTIKYADESTEIVTLESAGTVVVEGTPINAANMNAIVSGVNSAMTVASGKQDPLSAGSNITISGNVISAKDTTYKAGSNITISSDNTISANTSSVDSDSVFIYVHTSSGNDSTGTGSSSSPYKTLSKAVYEGSKHLIAWKNSSTGSSGSVINANPLVYIVIKSGSVISDAANQIYVRSQDLSHIWIVSEDTSVEVAPTSSWTSACGDSRGTMPFISAEYGGCTPTIATLFVCGTGLDTSESIVNNPRWTTNGIRPSGMCCNKGARGTVSDGGGFVGFHDGLIANNEASINARYGKAYSSGRWGGIARHNGELTARSLDVCNCGNATDTNDDQPGTYGCGLFADRCGDIDAKGASTSGSRVGVRSHNLSRINCNETNIWGNTTGCTVSNGGMVALTTDTIGSGYKQWSGSNGSTGTYSAITANTVTAQGIIFVGGPN